MTPQKFKRKQDIVKWLKLKCNDFTDYQLKQAVEAFFKNISTALIVGHKIEIRGLGTILVKTKEKKMVRNPKTNQQVEIKRPKRLYFRVSKSLLRSLNS